MFGQPCSFVCAGAFGIIALQVALMETARWSFSRFVGATESSPAEAPYLRIVKSVRGGTVGSSVRGLHVTNTNTGDLGAGRWPKLLLAAIAMTMLSAVHAQAQTWYLMAPDEKIMSNPRVSLRLLRGPVVGPLEFTSREKFPSREECEPARRKLITEWRQQSVMQRGHWARYGFNSPSPFILCIPDNNRHLKRASADTLPSMETFVNRPPHR